MEKDKSESTGDQAFSFAKQLQAFSKNPGLELDPMERPVSVTEGREVHRATVQAVEVFRHELLPNLNIGEKTKSAFESILDKIAGPEGVSIYATDQARFIRYEEWQGGRIAGQDGEPEVEMAPVMINTSKKWMDEAVQKSGVEIAPELASRLATGWIVWHELGHGLQAAYSDAAEPKPATEWVGPTKADLSDDAITWGASAPVDSGNLGIEHTVESERFAEGFGQMMVERYAVSNGVSSEDASRLRESLVPEGRKERAVLVKEIIDKYKADPRPEAISMVYTDLGSASQEFGRLTTNLLGYVEPYNPDQVQQIINLSAQLESLPWKKRLGQVE